MLSRITKANVAGERRALTEVKYCILNNPLHALGGENDVLNFKLYRSILLLTKVRRVEVECICGFYPAPGIPLPRRSHLTDLILTHCSFRRAEILQLLQGVTALKSFEYIHSHCNTLSAIRHQADRGWDPHGLRVALEDKAWRSLETMKLMRFCTSVFLTGLLRGSAAKLHRFHDCGVGLGTAHET